MWSVREELLAAATALLALATGASGATANPWPSLVGPREAFSPDVSAAVERVWIEPTFSRTSNGRSPHVPFDVDVAFLDTPEVTAAAATEPRWSLRCSVASRNGASFFRGGSKPAGFSARSGEARSL